MTLSPDKDGVDHINIYSRGRTALGRQLSNFYCVTTDTGADGCFRCIEGYWYWLSCHDDRLRYTDGPESKRLGRQLRAADWSADPAFKEKIALAIWNKINQTPVLAWALCNSSLPLTHYYAYDGKIVLVPEADWLVQAIKNFRIVLQVGQS